MNAQEFSEKVLEAQKVGSVIRLIDKALEEHSGVLSPEGCYSIEIAPQIFYKSVYDDIKQLMLSKGFTDVKVIISGYLGKPLKAIQYSLNYRHKESDMEAQEFKRKVVDFKNTSEDNITLLIEEALEKHTGEKGTDGFYQIKILVGGRDNQSDYVERVMVNKGFLDIDVKPFGFIGVTYNYNVKFKLPEEG